MTLEKNPRQIPFIDLVGDIEENFYQLGIRDAEAAKLALAHTESLIKTPWQGIDTSIRFLAKNLFIGSSKWKSRFSPWLNSYAEGLNQPIERVMLALLVPELTACLNKLLPRMPKSLMGCSSLFMRDTDGQPTHIRTLDFPLGTSFDVNERLLRTSFKDQPIITSYGSAGFPYPSLSASTSHGISFALHQKFNDTFDPEGTPIFELINDMLIRCGDLKTVLSFLRKSRSLTTWSFHMVFNDGQVLAADLSGAELNYEIQQLEDEPIYFNNELLRPTQDQLKISPLNFKNYNLWRHESAKRKIAKIVKEKKAIEHVLKTWSTLENRNSPSLDVLTPTSMHVCAMKPVAGEFVSIVGSAPKTWQGEVQVNSSLWENRIAPTKLIGKIKSKTNLDLTWRHLMIAQAAFDQGDIHQLHHHLQMAIRKSKDNSYIHALTKFYHCIFTFIHESDHRSLAQILSDLNQVSEKLDRSLRDHAWLMIARIERVLELSPSIYPAQIYNPSLAKLLEFENSIPNLIFKSTVSKLIHPRMDLIDVIYTHQNINN